LPHQGILFLAVPDGAVADMAARIAAMHPPRRLAIVHLSGARGLDELAAVAPNPRGSFHPLQSFPMPRPPSAFRGITIAVDATSPALERRLRALARNLGATPKHVGDGERVLYHAAAVFASNFLDVVVGEGVQLLRRLGWSEEEATRALLPLVDGAVDNIRNRGVVGALTGPIRRGDAETVARHLAALSPSGPSQPLRRLRRHLPINGEEPLENGEEAYRLYRMLGLVALRIAREAGLDPAAAERTRRALTRNVAATRRRSGG
jgi:predicted short-subunit dehydrogenase-like oxidoreductase (DUF2520 family)